MNALFEKLRLLFGGARKPDPDESEVRMHHPEPGPHANLGEHGAAHPDDDPEDLHRGRRRLKESHTSHWDLDYMPREDMEELAKANRKSGAKDDKD
jgi:hypothetical protein|tara:strand:+ start:38 stop:325 length:288 start_codon:yes stop_codon:yes gene_type:complete